jgi:peptide/nickel transport system permease protein
MSYSLRKAGKLASRILIVLILGGFLGATLVRLAPGFGTDDEELDSRLSQASIESLRRSHLQDDNLALFYAHYLEQLAVGNLGTSQTLHQPVRQLLAERFPETLKTVGLGLCTGWTAGFSLAIVAVMSRSWLVDLSASLLSSVLLCIPAAVLALLFVIVQAPGRLVVGLIVFPKIFNYARNLLAQSASLPHVLTARAKGVGNARLLVWHILPVAAPQLFALAGISVSISFAATIPVEVLCDLPGIGQLAWKAAMGRDLELLVDLTMIVTLITLLANAAAEMAAHPLQRGEI